MVVCSAVRDSHWTICIGGFRDITINDIDVFISRIEGAVGTYHFQVFDADNIAGWEHLYFAAVNAIKAYQTGVMISNSIGIETLLYASCQDQISKGFQIIGIKPATENVAFIVFAMDRKEALAVYESAEKVLGSEEDEVLKVSDEKFKHLINLYDVSMKEIDSLDKSKEEAITNILIEKGALLVTMR